MDRTGLRRRGTFDDSGELGEPLSSAWLRHNIEARVSYDQAWRVFPNSASASRGAGSTFSACAPTLPRRMLLPQYEAKIMKSPGVRKRVDTDVGEHTRDHTDDNQQPMQEPQHETRNLTLKCQVVCRNRCRGIRLSCAARGDGHKRHEHEQPPLLSTRQHLALAF
jgi:hypothetical protein